ncbi:MAG: hypothetical protein H3Z50_07705 [archaeon]|nr:hypothetical protein [archaeon]
MLTVDILEYNELTEEQKEVVSNNGVGKKNASYLCVSYDGTVIALESDAMEPEDATFYRDLSWIRDLLLDCYNFGLLE